jgi:chromosome segregation ATPase
MAERKPLENTIGSKAIATRIPMQDYIKFLQEAVDMKITINDWLYFKIYSKEDSKASIAESAKKVKALEEQLNHVNGLYKKMSTDHERMKANYEKQVEELKGKVKQSLLDIDTLTKKEKTVSSDWQKVNSDLKILNSELAKVKDQANAAREELKQAKAKHDSDAKQLKAEIAELRQRAKNVIAKFHQRDESEKGVFSSGCYDAKTYEFLKEIA